VSDTGHVIIPQLAAGVRQIVSARVAQVLHSDLSTLARQSATKR